VGTTRDGVILDYDDGSGEQQCTVITSQQGPLKGQRLVRGREADWAPYDQEQQGQPPCFRYRTLCGIDHGVIGREARRASDFRGWRRGMSRCARIYGG